MSRTVERILKYVDFIGLSKNKFYLSCGLPNGSFNQIKSVGSENLEKIFAVYPELNFDWVITGRGEMLKGKIDVECKNCVAWEKKYNEMHHKYTACLEENKAIEKKQFVK